MKLSPELQLKQMDHVLDAIETPENTQEVDKIRSKVKAGLYALLEEFDEDFAQEIIDEITPKIDRLAIPAQQHIVYFQNSVKGLISRYKNLDRLKDTLVWKSAVKILIESIGEKRANLEIEAFLQANVSHFDTIPSPPLNQ